MKRYISFILIFLFIFSFSTGYLNAENNEKIDENFDEEINEEIDNEFDEQYFKEVRDNCAQTLVKLNILKGYEDGTLRLNNKILRSEFITLVVRLMGYHKDTDIDNIEINFKDIEENHWAYDNIKLAIKYNIVTGYPDNTIAPNNNVTYAEALAVIINALGYEDTLDGEWPDNVVEKATELKLDKNLNIEANTQITRGEMSVLIYNALTVPLKSD
ncbi:S-layer homology domain-containing protein [Herbivorax sp. ANBcel31]|uniref:S-layer homology domain-containing protein n=1 Tax=Herbivorax sp. ANBcel31 TaxID=3069754 RepID=UPI0027B58DDA|nr:S-layer homology domain-containing protein [Herbivorax sp. ANBcel31]MDQ2086028.1 S-layer homology domain-containing protein [Herbivorax sp. ANBcel31]